MINIRNIEKLLEIIGKVACVISYIAGLIWSYREGSLWDHFFLMFFGGLIIFALPFALMNKSSHQSLCKFLRFKFPYIIYLLPAVIFMVLAASAFVESAYYGYNANLNR